MQSDIENVEAMPVIRSRKDFDRRSGSLVERLIFNHRWMILTISALLIAFLGFEASKLTIGVSFQDMMPKSSEFIQNYLENADSLRSLGNSVRIVVENKKGSIYSPQYLRTLREINDRVYVIRGVDRAFVKSLWMPVVRWTEVTADGYQGGPVMPDDYDGSAASIDRLRVNIARAGITGSIVANDQRSSMIFVPLLTKYGDSGAPINDLAVRDAWRRSVPIIRKTASPFM